MNTGTPDFGVFPLFIFGSVSDLSAVLVKAGFRELVFS